ncbi:uncharacterized protein LOC114310544 [Camellia sinensis]|uniref:uncharacterized protein LOC114310544 n=1 Tax=Camellia sinensis TaxID=4442 RepID=UPI00103569D5|nr:uncharacterized protein LOC114310544 [Camellia sinensis]
MGESWSKLGSKSKDLSRLGSFYGAAYVGRIYQNIIQKWSMVVSTSGLEGICVMRALLPEPWTLFTRTLLPLFGLVVGSVFFFFDMSKKIVGGVLKTIVQSLQSF